MLYIAHHSEQSPLHLIGHMYLVLDYLTRSSSSRKQLQSGKLQDFYVREATSFIEQNFQNDITVEDIAAFCNLNRSYFGKIFRDAVGKSPQEFLISYRMTKAAELLKLTGAFHQGYQQRRRLPQPASFFTCIQKNIRDFA